MAIGYTVVDDRLTEVLPRSYSLSIEVVESARLVDVEVAGEVNRRIAGFLSE